MLISWKEREGKWDKEREGLGYRKGGNGRAKEEKGERRRKKEREW